MWCNSKFWYNLRKFWAEQYQPHQELEKKPKFNIIITSNSATRYEKQNYVQNDDNEISDGHLAC